MSMNSITLAGNVGSIDVKGEDKGRHARVRLATKERITKSTGEKIEETDWHTLIFWANRVDIVENHLKKGMTIAVRGRQKNNEYTRPDGSKGISSEVHVKSLTFLR